MRHIGDVTQVHGDWIPPVDVIIGGSPCQDLSVAGKRAGLSGERSGLFMEQIRIIKEMRKKDAKYRSDRNVRPRYMVWENVFGAFSSNKGEDFRVVLEEIAKVRCEDAHVPLPEKGKWKNAGCIVGDGWSIAWRVLDAQFWGVPQRRRRIALVADFGGESAQEILFERKGLRGCSEEIGETRERVADPVEESTRVHDCDGLVYDARGNGDGLVVNTITGDHENRITDYTALAVFRKKGHPRNSEEGQAWEETDKADTLNTFDNSDVHTPQVIVELDRAAYNQGKNAQFDIGISEDGVAHTVVAKGPGAVCYAIGNGQVDQTAMSEVARTLDCMHDQQAVMVARAVDLTNLNESDTNGSLQASAEHNIHSNNVVRVNYIVRRLTPLECERLQGYPDGWTDIGYYTAQDGKRRKTSDSVRYKALGNSIALPQWKWILKRISAQYERDATMGSLFDGIGGFPYLWEQINGKGSCVWASEIEDFPIAVSNRRINQHEN